MRRALRTDSDLNWATRRRRIENVENCLRYVVGLDHLAPIQMLDRRNHWRVDEAGQNHRDFDAVLYDFLLVRLSKGGSETVASCIVTICDCKT